MPPIKTFITSWNRLNFLEQVLSHIEDRTTHPHEIHIFDNGSDMFTQDRIYGLLKNKKIKSAHFQSENTGCLYNKLIYHAMVESTDKYFLVTDNDILPPKLDPCWLSQMLYLMEINPDLGVLTPQLPPIFLQEPYKQRGDIVLCKAVGNTFRLVRKEAFPTGIEQKIGTYGDDGLICRAMRENGWKVGFCSKIWCYNLERTVQDYGYTKEQLAQDPRKQGYDPNSRAHDYRVGDWDTLEPPEHLTYGLVL